VRFVHLSDDLLPQIKTLINTQIAQIPPCQVLSTEQVAAALATPHWWAIHYPEEATPDHSEIFGILDGDQLEAAAQVFFTKMGQAVLRWIVARPEACGALTELLGEIAKQARCHASREVCLSRYGFGLGWIGIPRIWTHLISGLEQAGFQPAERWVLMSGTTHLPPMRRKDEPPGMRLEWTENPSAAEWRLEAYAHGELAGDCDAWGIPPYFGAGQPNWITIEWIGVEAAYRGQGVGRWLFHEMLSRQARRDMQNALLWTGVDNWPMRRLAESLGFHAGPICQAYASLSLDGG